MRRRISRAQQTKNWCVGFSFPPPAYAGIHPTLYLFGFGADALNSHSPPSCLVSSASIPFQDLRERLWAFPVVAFGAPKPSGGLRGLRGFRGPWCRAFWAAVRLRGPPAGLRGASGGLRGASGVPPGASGGPREDFGGLEPFFWVWALGLVVGFAFFGLRPQPPAWRIPNFSIFQATSWRRLASGPPERPAEDPQGQGCWV